MSLKRPLNVFEIVSVSTKVPDTNATPSITAMPVSRKRTFLLQMPLSVTFHMAGALRAEALHLVEDVHHDRLAELVDRLAHEGQDLGARTLVEVAGGLVGEDDLRFAEQGPSD